MCVYPAGLLKEKVKYQQHYTPFVRQKMYNVWQNCLCEMAAGDDRLQDTGEDMEKITVRLPRRYLEIIDFLVENDYFSSRTEAIRTAVRDLVMGAGKIMDSLKTLETIERTMREKRELKERYLKP